MKTFQLTAEPRTVLGKKASKALRNDEKIPVVLNGGKIVDLPYAGTLEEGQKVVELCNNKGIITTDLTVTAEAVRKLIYSPDIFAIELTVNGVKKNAILKDLQFHPVTDKVLHIDLLEVTDEKPVVMEVPVKLEGHAEGVKAGGKLSQAMRKMKVNGIYTQFPDRVVVDVTSLGLGKKIAVSDVHIDGLTMMNPKDACVAEVKATRQSAKA